LAGINEEFGLAVGGGTTGNITKIVDLRPRGSSELSASRSWQTLAEHWPGGAVPTRPL